MEEQQKIAEEERQKLEQKRKDEVMATSITAHYNIPSEPSSFVPSFQTDGHHPQQQLPAVSNVPTMVHQPITEGVSPMVDRSNKPVHLMQPYSLSEPSPLAQPTSQDIPAHPIVDRSTKPSSQHDSISDVYLSGIGQCYHGNCPYSHPILSAYPIG